MALFIIAVLPSAQSEQRAQLREAVEREVAEADRWVLNEWAWLIAYPGTAASLSEKVGINGGTMGGALVATVNKFAGFGPRVLSDWISQKRDNDGI